MLRTLLPIAAWLGLTSAPALAADPPSALAPQPVMVVPAPVDLGPPRQVPSGALRTFSVGRRLRGDGRSPRLPGVGRVRLAPAFLPLLRAGLLATLPPEAPTEGPAALAVLERAEPRGEAMEMTLAGALVTPFVATYRDPASSLCESSGRLLSGSAGVALCPGGRWMYRMQLTRRAMNSVTSATVAQDVSLAAVRRF